MAIKRNVLAESGATVQAEDGTTMYATIQMRHGKESDMDKSKFVPAEMGVTTDTKKVFMAFGSNQVKEMMFREDSEIEELLGEVREISDKAVEAVESAEATAKQAIEDYTDQMKATIPEDYTEMVKKVDVLERTKAPAIYQTVSGESLQIEDSADAPMAGLRVFGKSRQVVTTGAQLLDESIFNNLPHNANVIYKPIRVQNNGEYTLSTDMDTGKDSTNLFLLPGNVSTGANSSTNGVYKDHPITVQSSDNYVTVGYRYGTTSPLNPKDYHNMLNSGSTALPWEPYTGGKPSPSPDYPQDIEVPGSEGNVGVNVTGNQLLDIRNKISANNTGVSVSVDGTGGITINGTITKDTADIYLAGNWNSPNIVLPADTYTLSCDGATSDERLLFIKGTSVSSAAGNSHLTTTNDITGIFIRLLKGKTYTNFKMYPMLNKCSTALPFEPYKNTSISISTPNGLPGIPVDSGGNYTDSDGQQWICDEIDYARGKYVQRVGKVVLSGDENWSESSMISNRYYISAVRLNAKPRCNGMCNRYTYVFGTTTDINQCTIDLTPSFYVNTEFTNVGEFKSYLSEHPITVFYELATPVETDLSEEELTAYAALRTNYPTTVVTSDSDPITVGIEVEYVADTQKYIDNKFAELAQNLAATQNTLLEV